MTSPVWDKSAEQAVLANILLTPAILRPLSTEIGLRTEHFYLPSHQDIYRAMLDLHDQGDPNDRIDQTALTRRIDQTAAQALAVLIGDGYSDTAWRVHAEAVIRCSRYERTRAAAEQLAHGAHTMDDDLIAEAERLLTEPAGHDGTTLDPETRKTRALERMDEEQPPVMPLPWGRVNDLIVGGMWPGRYMLLGGHGKHGKSCAVDGALDRFAAQGKKVALYLTETTEQERTERSIARNGPLTYTQVQKYFQAPKAPQNRRYDKDIADTIRSLPSVACVEAHDWTVQEITRHIAHAGWDACAVDILHDIPLPRGQGMSTVDAYQEIGRQLLQCAKRTRTAMIVASHLNDSRVVDAPPVPVNRDFRGCGMLYRQADVAMMVWQEENDDGPTGDGVIKVTACRQGQTGLMQAAFNGSKQRWRELGSVQRLAAA